MSVCMYLYKYTCIHTDVFDYQLLLTSPQGFCLLQF